MKKYFVYLARCNDESLYTGYTTDIVKREQRHNAGEGAKYTRQRRPVKIIYSEEYTSVSDAMKRERQIKGWSKQKKEALVKSNRSN